MGKTRWEWVAQALLETLTAARGSAASAVRPSKEEKGKGKKNRRSWNSSTSSHSGFTGTTGEEQGDEDGGGGGAGEEEAAAQKEEERKASGGKQQSLMKYGLLTEESRRVLAFLGYEGAAATRGVRRERGRRISTSMREEGRERERRSLSEYPGYAGRMILQADSTRLPRFLVYFQRFLSLLSHLPE